MISKTDESPRLPEKAGLLPSPAFGTASCGAGAFQEGTVFLYWVKKFET